MTQRRQVSGMSQIKKGKLKIFFSYAESIGKTQAMLKAAQAARTQGDDVVAGCISTHSSPETLALMEGLEKLSAWEGEEDSFDLDKALERAPDLILVDELAHSNGKSSRHRKRYQDVDELLKSGISVYTTVNVGNIESLHDTVASITGITTWDRIPDYVFENADQVELIDIEPQELIERLQEKGTADSRITVEQLTALREVALRFCADRIKRLSDQLGRENSFHTDEHILVCLSSAPSNEKIIRTAARMARAFNSKFSALFVETPDFSAATPENKNRLRDNTKLAEQLGANIETVYGEDVPYQIAEYARLSGITKVVLGRSAVTRRHLLGKPTLTEQLLSYIPDMDIHIIPDKSADTAYRPKKSREGLGRSILKNTARSIAILLGATLLCVLFDSLGFTDANLIMIYILGVLMTSIMTPHKIYSLVSSIVSVFLFNFLFILPRFSLAAHGTGYPMTFITMFLTAYITGTLAKRYKEQAGQSAKAAYRTKILFDTDRMLSKADGKDNIIDVAAGQIIKLLNRDIIVYENQKDGLSGPLLFSPDDPADRTRDSEEEPEKSFREDKNESEEREIAKWVSRNNHAAGAFTDTMSDASRLYLPISVGERVYGVVGIEAGNDPVDASEYGILLSILGEAALALENEKNAREKEETAVFAKSEQLRADLLRTISHDLRTPLTTISGNAGMLLHNSSSFDEETKKQIYSDMYDDSLWLINLVENLLYATRIEEGRMSLRTGTELLSEIVEEALNHVSRRAEDRQISAVSEEEFLLVKADAKLAVQVITNIVDNAVKYTPPGSSVVITTARKGAMAEVRVADSGEGIPDEEKTKIFEKFYRGDQKIADNRRSLGLGLYLCRAIVEAHGGTIYVTDNEPRGSVFHFTLPLEEAYYHE